jgi:hypothetical protein
LAALVSAGCLDLGPAGTKVGITGRVHPLVFTPLADSLLTALEEVRAGFVGVTDP